VSSSAREPDDDAADAVTLQGVRAELRRVRAGLVRIEEGLAALERDGAAPAPRARTQRRPRPERYLRLLVDVYERGGRHGLDSGAFGALGAAHGYDRRGLGGFFRGEHAPLALVEGRVQLTPEGARLVDEHLRELSA